MSQALEDFLLSLKRRLRRDLNRTAVAELMPDIRTRRVMVDGFGQVHVRSTTNDELISGNEDMLLDLLAGEIVGGVPESARRGRGEVTPEEMKAKIASSYNDYF